MSNATHQYAVTLLVLLVAVTAGLADNIDDETPENTIPNSAEILAQNVHNTAIKQTPNLSIIKQNIAAHTAQNSLDIDLALMSRAEALMSQLTNDQAVHHADIDLALGGINKLNNLHLAVTTSNVSESCQRRWSQFTVDLLRFKPYALKAFDSFGKPESGISQGNLKWFGSFDQCREVTWDKLPGTSDNPAVTKGQYCTVALTSAQGATILQTAFCFPDECNEKEATEIAANIFTGSHVTAQCYYDREADASAIIWFVWAALVVALVIVGTTWETVANIIAKRKKEQADIEKAQPGSREQNSAPKNGIVKDFAYSFSLLTNGTKLLNTAPAGDQFLASLNGMRVISMWWIVMGHVCLFVLPILSNMTHIVELFGQFDFQTVTQMPLGVDTFFFCSGLLTCYLNLKKLHKGNGSLDWFMFYFHRLWRLTPLYMFCVLFFMGVYKMILTGPYAEVMLRSSAIETCYDYWWANLLYVNNFVPGNMNHICMGHSWYLANDMQFFVISPIFIYLLYRWRYAGFAVIGAVLTASVCLTGAIADHNDMSPQMLSNKTMRYTDRQNDMVDFLYVRPYYRIAPYLVGMVFGYVFYKTRGKMRLPWYLAVLGWVVCTVVSMLLVFGFHPYYKDFSDPSPGIATWYYACGRGAWAVCMGWVVFACGHGYAGPINSLLSWRAWNPLYKLNYAAYLIHPIVIFYYLIQKHTTVYYTDYTAAHDFLGNLMITYGFSIVAMLAVESPMQGLEKVIFRK